MFSGRIHFSTTSVRPVVACKAGPKVKVKVAQRVPAARKVDRATRISFGGSLSCVNFRPNRSLLNGGVSCIFLNTYAGNHVRSFHTFTSVIGKHGGTRGIVT